MSTVDALRLLYNRNVTLSVPKIEDSYMSYQGLPKYDLLEVILRTDPILMRVVGKVLASGSPALAVTERQYLAVFNQKRVRPGINRTLDSTPLVRYYVYDLEYLNTPGMQRLAIEVKRSQLTL